MRQEAGFPGFLGFLGTAFPPGRVLRVEGHGGDDPGGRRARSWIIRHCPCVNGLILGDIRLLSLGKSWKLGQNKHGEAKGCPCLCVWHRGEV